jgi:anti-sigma regulatory factor (Ser/Thr protein kinase)
LEARNSSVAVTGTGLRHDALVYDSDEEFVSQVASFLRTGIEEDAASVAVLRPSNWSLLREALGSASEEVSFRADPEEWYTRPVVAIGGYDAALRDYLKGGRSSIRVVGELPMCSTEEEWNSWKSYEAILNRAFAGYPAWILCAYDQRVLPEQVVEGAWHTHEQVLTDGWAANRHYHEPEHLVRTLAPWGEVALELRELPSADDPHGFRDRLTREMAAAGVPEDRARDMLVAANEIVVNAWAHGGGPSTVRAGQVGESFVCEISDPGPGLDDPLAGYLPPRLGQMGGAGMWIARQFARRLDVFDSGPGLVVRLWI